MQCEERVNSPRSATFSVGRQGVWFEEKICSISDVTSAVRMEKVCSIRRRVASKVREEGSQCEERTYSIRRVTSEVGGQGWWSEEKSAL